MTIERMSVERWERSEKRGWEMAGLDEVSRLMNGDRINPELVVGRRRMHRRVQIESGICGEDKHRMSKKGGREERKKKKGREKGVPG